MHDFWKMVTTSFAWLILGGVAIAVLFTDMSSMDRGIISLTAMILAFAVTGLLWVAPQFMQARMPRDTTRYHTQASVKSKRGDGQPLDKYSLLLQMMDEDEKAAFKRALQARLLADPVSDDGELRAGSALFEEDDYDDYYEKRLRR
ncbi:MAG: hypothetical protein ACOCYT_05485 [Chloroflexota bacterium]